MLTKLKFLFQKKPWSGKKQPKFMKIKQICESKVEKSGDFKVLMG